MSDTSMSSQHNNHQSVTRLLILLTVSVFLIELLVTITLESLPPMPKTVMFLLDSTTLATLNFPIFYFLVFRPLMKSIADLRKAEEELRTVSVAFESKDPILITDPQANILLANKAFLTMTGYNPEEIIGKNPRILQADRNSRDYYKNMWDHLLQNGSWVSDIRIKDKREREFTMGITITAVKNEHRETTHYVATYQL